MKKLFIAAALAVVCAAATDAQAGPLRRLLDRRHGGETHAERHVERHSVFDRAGPVRARLGGRCGPGGCN